MMSGSIGENFVGGLIAVGLLLLGMFGVVLTWWYRPFIFRLLRYKRFLIDPIRRNDPDCANVITSVWGGGNLHAVDNVEYRREQDLFVYHSVISPGMQMNERRLDTTFTEIVKSKLGDKWLSRVAVLFNGHWTEADHPVKPTESAN